MITCADIRNAVSLMVHVSTIVSTDNEYSNNQAIKMPPQYMMLDKDIVLFVFVIFVNKDAIICKISVRIKNTTFFCRFKDIILFAIVMVSQLKTTFCALNGGKNKGIFLL